jgi:hypothetical protein
VISLGEFLALVHDEIGLPLTAGDADLSFDQLPDWDSMHLLALLQAVERSTGRPVSLPDVLTAGSLHDVYEVVVRG